MEHKRAVCGDFNVLREEIDIYSENEREYYALQVIVSDERTNLKNLMEMGFVDAFRFKYPKEKIRTHFGAIDVTKEKKNVSRH